MNELVERFATKKSKIVASRIDNSSKELKKSIDRKYVHIRFSETGTELGIKLDLKNCSVESCNFDTGDGIAHVEGGLTLNYEKVRVIADVDLER